MNVKASRIRYATIAEVDSIQAIERRAESVFSEIDLPLQLRHGLPLETIVNGISSENLWVSVSENDVPLGFALVEANRLDLHLEEVSVDPDSSRKGHGRALVKTVIKAAADRNFDRVTLTTFSHLAWNRPFYESCGFRVLTDSATEDVLRSKLLEEQNVGFANRVAMTLVVND